MTYVEAVKYKPYMITPKLSNAERNDQGDEGMFHEEEAVRTCDQDKRLRDDGNLQAYNGVKLRVVGIWWESWYIEHDTEFVIEEACLQYDGNQRDAKISWEWG